MKKAAIGQIDPDGRGQSKITTDSAVANVMGDFTLTPEFMSLCSDPGIQRELQ